MQGTRHEVLGEGAKWIGSSQGFDWYFIESERIELLVFLHAMVCVCVCGDIRTPLKLNAFIQVTTMALVLYMSINAFKQLAFLIN